ncbi:MAG: phenylalanine--tRNA ligase subunit alpha [Candidatus Berkelbacteria bacterium]|nr:phenylalanine--tRNA ligase subunit alpha [Candidatus Berkelbacteria bacterium]
MKLTGNLHPISQILRRTVEFFSDYGFSVYFGPEVDSEWYNFDALNVPADHPSRDVQDTFWLTDGRLLRTQTSNSQVRYGESHKPPIKIIVPGVCYRNEATDAGHETTFIQLEGLFIDKNVSLGQLFWILEKFYKKIYGDETELRFRPHHFPYTEPSIEFEMKFRGRWFELGGAGMVHPKVISNMGIDPNKYSGFAFGPGIERPIMVKYGIKDIRHFRSGDLRFLKQFK